MENLDYQILNDTTPIQIWGKNIRLIREDDAKFISNLRSDKRRTKYMLTLENDVEKQQEWIRKYKQREKKHEDFYFMFVDDNGERLGVVRNYDINRENKSCKAGALIKVKGGESNLAMAMFMFVKSFVFDVLELEYYLSDFNAENVRVLSMHQQVGYPIPEKSENGFIYLNLKKDDYISKAGAILASYNLTNTSEYHPLKIKI